MAYLTPTVAQFKAQFVRDFPYGSTSDKVMDADITSALTAASFNINNDLFDSQAEYTFAFNYLTAHHLVMSLKNSAQGVAGSFSWLENSKSVGSISQSFSIPEDILKHPVLSLLCKTTYGAYYLSVVLPRLCGHIMQTAGGTQS